MRLICPNCGAQYEVAADAIPENGRDVQCSNCGHTWFENPGASVAAEEELSAAEESTFDQNEESTLSDEVGSDEPDFYEDEDAGIDDSSGSDVEFDDDAEIEADADAETEEDAQDDTSEDNDDASDDTEIDETASNAPVGRHELESSVASILREEADREQSARREESPLEIQTDLPIEPAAETGSETRSRIARLKGEEDANAAAVAALAASEASRKETLPDIDEISDTLRSNAERGEVVPPSPEEVEETKKTGFRWGFWGILFLILFAVLLYLFSDMIVAAVPALEGPVTQYAGLVDGLRSSINGLAENAVSSLEGDAGAASE